MTKEEVINIAKGLLTDFKVESDTMADFCNTVITLVQESCKDTISRQAVIDTIDKWVKTEHILETLPTDKVTPLFKSVHKLPPVNPQYTKDEIQKMQDLEQAEIEKAYELGKTEIQKSEDAISREAVLDLCDSKDPEYKVVHFKEDVECLPPVNPQVKIGHWKHNKCDVCGASRPPLFDNFCPNCGAKMEAKKMKRCIVSYYPSANKIHNIYDSVKEARKDVKMCNLFSNGGEKLAVAYAELTDEEYAELTDKDCVTI